MFMYYVRIAWRSLLRTRVLSVLMVAAIALGISASMTTLTVFRAMSGDPIPQKSRHLYVPQIDNWGLTPSDKSREPPDQLTYTDAQALLRAHWAPRQTATYSVVAIIRPADPALSNFEVDGRAANSDFFAMFDVPFHYGSAWTVAEDTDETAVVVISDKLNAKLFGGANSVGKTLSVDGRDFRIVGVLGDWHPVPRVYDVSTTKFGDTEELFLPFNLAIARQMQSSGNNNCDSPPAPGWEGHLHSECVWLQYWAELPSAADATHYRQQLEQYVQQQQDLGRFRWPPRLRLRNARQWLDFQHVVSDEVQILVVVSFSFLFVCLVNAVGLLLAKFTARSAEIGVRRALGAARHAVFLQCLVEVGVVGLSGGLLGLLLTALGLRGLQALFSAQIERLAVLDPADVGLALSLAVAATLLAGLYPTWRATRVQPAWQLKSN